jgi:hypothetical protein
VSDGLHVRNVRLPPAGGPCAPPGRAVDGAQEGDIRATAREGGRRPNEAGMAAATLGGGHEVSRAGGLGGSSRVLLAHIDGARAGEEDEQGRGHGALLEHCATGKESGGASAEAAHRAVSACSHRCETSRARGPGGFRDSHVQ